MGSKRAKHKGRERRRREREQEAERITLKHKCSRCGNALPKGQDMCESCAELQGASIWQGGTEGSHTAACDGEDHFGQPCPTDYP